MLTLSDVNPILEWEMRTLARRKRYYALRVAYLAAPLLILCCLIDNPWSGVTMSRSQMSAAADQLFQFLSTLQVAVVLTLTPVYVGTSIVMERERKALDFLLATHLTDGDIVVGKWTARSLNVLLLVLAGAPGFFLLILLGGVATSQIVAITVVTLATLASTAALAIRASIGARQKRDAIVNAFLFLAAWFVFPYLITIPYFIVAAPILDMRGPNYLPLDLFAVLNPLFAILICNGSLPISEGVGWRVVWYVVFHMLLTIRTLRASIRRLRPMHEEQQKGDRAQREFDEKHYQLKIPPVGDNPLIWREWYLENRWTTGKIIFAVLAIYVMIMTAIISLLESKPRVFAGESTMIIAAVYATIAVKISQAIVRERDRECWTSLITAPISGRQMILEKIVGNLRPLALTMTCLVPIWIVQGIAGILPLSAFAFLCITILGHTLFIAGIAINASLRCANAVTATIVTLTVAAAFAVSTWCFVNPSFRSGSNSELWVAFTGASPLQHLWNLQTFGQTERWANTRELHFSVWSLVFAALYGQAGLAMILAAIADFDRTAGRATGNAR